MLTYNQSLNKWFGSYKDFCFNYFKTEKLYRRKRVKHVSFMLYTRKRKNKSKKFWKNLAFEIVVKKRNKKTEYEKEIKELTEELAYHFQRYPVVNDSACLYAKARLAIALDNMRVANSRIKKHKDKRRRSMHHRDLGRIYHRKYLDMPDENQGDIKKGRCSSNGWFYWWNRERFPEFYENENK